MRIVLIGFRGTGKSVIGKEISQYLKYRYISIDDLIRKHFTLSVSEIVEKYGWREFRKVEARLIFETRNLDNVIIDSGGGSILTQKNRNNLKYHSVVIQFQANRKDIAKRIQEGNDRPMLTNEASIRKEINRLLKERKELYDSITDYKINTSRNSIVESKKKIINFIEGLL